VSPSTAARSAQAAGPNRPSDAAPRGRLRANSP
jgi:hypothetical protein